MDLSPREGQGWVCRIQVGSVSEMWMGKRNLGVTARALVFSSEGLQGDVGMNPQMLESTLGDLEAPFVPWVECLLCWEGQADGKGLRNQTQSSARSS